MTNDGPGDDSYLDRSIRDSNRRREFEQSFDYPDSEHSTPNDQDIAFQKWKRERGYDR